MFEVLASRKEEIEQSDVLARLDLKENKYFLISAHREENINSDKNFMGLVNSMNTIAETYDMPVIVSTHPRTRNKIEEKGINFHPHVQLMKPLGFNDYNHLQIHFKAVLSDSGTISEESSILVFRALNIRAAQERFGKGKIMNGEQVRWGLENLNLTQAKLDALGFAGVLRPISTSCTDHMGASWARLHTWDGKNWNFTGDWLQGDEQIIRPMVKAAAAKYAAEKKITPRTPADCQS